MAANKKKAAPKKKVAGKGKKDTAIMAKARRRQGGKMSAKQHKFLQTMTKKTNKKKKGKK